ncbi:hypothetical protein GCM10007977_007030 [Dactylosporangium sucinum]|uniref:Uncharacterized protein n=2 Tax=Dactylosporangium sucinum TaxID=1424081 RepID=A0A917T365_9ACTN|nr:hypothetical protein GCM10007977_007030 [Dactylosporangium sucinum]
MILRFHPFPAATRACRPGTIIGMLHLDPDSVLVKTAAELQIRHLERDADDPSRCAACGAPLPCPTEAAAALVCRAGGLWLEGDTLVDALEPPTQLLAILPAPVG